MTVVLLTSSLTMLGGVAAAREGRRGATMKWLGATVLLGSLFAILHLREWSGMLHEGWSLSANPMGGSVLVGALFFSITGLHLLHVISGVVAIIVIAIGFQTGRLTAGHVETTGTLLALRGSRLDVRVSARVPAQRPLNHASPP